MSLSNASEHTCTVLLADCECSDCVLCPQALNMIKDCFGLLNSGTQGF